MAVPATTGKLCDRIEDMKIGDYIRWYHDGANYVMNNDIGNMSEIPIEGQANSISGLAMYWYGVKVSKGLIVSDRVIRHSWSWDSINSSRSIEPRFETISDINGIIRSLSGGVAWADENGNISLTDKGFGGWPTNNEWDRYIVNFPSYKIQSGKTIDDVFHYNDAGTRCMETPVIGFGGATQTESSQQRIFRRGNTAIGRHWSYLVMDTSGFRPVFEYKEV